MASGTQEARTQQQSSGKELNGLMLVAAVWRYRRPATGVLLAVLVGVVSVWAQRHAGAGGAGAVWARVAGVTQWLKVWF